MKENKRMYYAGDFFTKAGAGIIGGGIVAVSITQTVKYIPITMMIVAIFFLIFGYCVMDKYGE